MSVLFNKLTRTDLLTVLPKKLVNKYTISETGSRLYACPVCKAENSFVFDIERDDTACHCMSCNITAKTPLEILKIFYHGESNEYIVNVVAERLDYLLFSQVEEHDESFTEEQHIELMKLKFDPYDKGDVRGKNNAIIAWCYMRDYDITVLSNGTTNQVWKYHRNKSDRFYGLWKMVNNLDELNADISNYVQNDFTFADAKRRNSIIAEILTMPTNRLKYSTSFNLTKSENNRKYIRYKDNLLRIKDRKFMEYEPGLFITNKLPFNYANTTKAPSWYNYFDTCFVDRDQATKDSLRIFLQYKIGQMLVGDTSTQDMLLLVGAGGCGKSRIGSLCYYLVEGINPESECEHSATNVSKVHPTQLSQGSGPLYAASLYGKMLNLCGEVSHSVQLDSDLLKEIIANDTISAKHLYKNPFTFTNTALFIAYANELPYMKNADESMRRRIKIIQWKGSFTAPDSPMRDKMDTNILVKLIQDAPAIINISLKTYFESESYPIPTDVEKATTNYIKDENTVLAFVEECCEFYPRPIDEGTNEVVPEKDWKHATKNTIYTSYTDYCKDNGKQPCSWIQFVRRLETNFSEKIIIHGDRAVWKQCRITIHGIGIVSSVTVNNINFHDL